MYSEYNFTDFEVIVYHAGETNSTVYLNVPLHDLTYEKNEDQTSEARFRIQSELYSNYNDPVPLDTNTYIFRDTAFSGEEMNMIVNFEIAAAYSEDYLLKITLTDLLKPEHEVMKIQPVNKTNIWSAQNFMLLDDADIPVFSTWMTGTKKFRIQYNNRDSTELLIRYYDQSFPLAKPPFALDKNTTYAFEPDSFYTVPLDAGISPLLELPHKGIYHVQADVEDKNGLTLYRSGNGFPEVTDPEQALAPLRYLTTEREFNTMLSYDEFKIAIDSFWLERASYNPERAKNMIRKYYQRVEQTNRMFSSFHEGWKTDRGLIYIIYGPPSEVYRKDDEEEWIYGERGNPMSIKFFFFNIDNPFTQNDFTLQRSPIYKTSWFIAVENWRR
jgi:GWxTD domain-containing protein